MVQKQQSYAHHTRYYPIWHFVAFPILAVHVIVTLVVLVRDFTLWNAWMVLVAVALVLGLFASRIMALRNQDRIIRLEQRVRLAQLLSPDLQARIPELTLNHLVALRFAPDDEVVGLVERCLSGELPDRKAVKEAIKNWQADWHRV